MQIIRGKQMGDEIRRARHLAACVCGWSRIRKVSLDVGKLSAGEGNNNESPEWWGDYARNRAR